MEILIDRNISTVESTTSKVYVDGAFECFALEDRNRGLKATMPLKEITEKKVFGKTCIPEGRYEVTITHSEHFNRDLPLLIDVPGYEGVRIHPGNTAADTEGCILPGEVRTLDMVLNSKKAFGKLYDKIHAAISNETKVFITLQS